MTQPFKVIAYRSGGWYAIRVPALRIDRYVLAGRLHEGTREAIAEETGRPVEDIEVEIERG